MNSPPLPEASTGPPAPSGPPAPQPQSQFPRRKLLDDAPALMRLRTRQLLLAEALGREQHLGRAAAALGISQPAATRLLQELEDLLGARLFDRHAKGLAPTPAGLALVRYARQLLEDFGHTRRELAALAAGLHGRLRLGAVPSALPALVAPLLVRFKAAHPRVAVALEVATSDLMLAQLGRGEVELVFGRLVEGHHDDVHDLAPVLAEAQVVVARAGHPLRAPAPGAGDAAPVRPRRATARPPVASGQGAPVDGPAASARPDEAPTLSLAELARWPWVLQPPGSPQAGRFAAMMREAGVHQRLDVTETASTIATTALLDASDMLAVMPASLAAHYARLGVLAVLPVDLPLQVPDVHLIWRRGRTLSPAAEAFRALVLGSSAAGAPGDAASAAQAAPRLSEQA